MTENFDRAPGAGRVRVKPNSPGVGDRFSEVGDGDSKASLFNQREPLRQPRTSPPSVDGNQAEGVDGDCGKSNKTYNSQHSNNGTTKEQPADSLVKLSSLSVNAPEFYPSSYVPQYQEAVYEQESHGYYPEVSLPELVDEFLSHLNSNPGSFESDIAQITDTLNSCVTTEDNLKELVELIYTQSTSIPNFAYTGTRVCNYLSHHLAFSPASGNFRQLLLKRCQTEFEQRDKATRGDEKTQKSFHSYVLFLGELYLNLEVKSAKGTPSRADILLTALRELMNSLFSNPVDGNLKCAVKLLQLTGSVLEDAWKEAGRLDMDELVQRIKNIVLDGNCSRDVKQMLLRVVELRSSNWGRVHVAAATNEATPDNDPNYFMNEPTFYTADGTPFTAADPEYLEKYQEIMDREDCFPDMYEQDGNEDYSDDDDEDEMDPEIEEAYEKFCLESESKRKQ